MESIKVYIVHNKAFSYCLSQPPVLFLTPIKEVVEEDVVRVLVGNKMDLLDLPSPPVDGAESDGNKVSNRRSRQVPTATGLQLSEVYISFLLHRVQILLDQELGREQGRKLIEH